MIVPHGVEKRSGKKSVLVAVSSGIVSATHGGYSFDLRDREMELEWGAERVGEREAGGNRLEHSNAFELDSNSWYPGGIWYPQVFSQKDTILDTKPKALKNHRPI